MQQIKTFLPLILNKYPFEKDAPSCRWTTYSLAYMWGDRLQNPNSAWRVAFEAATVDWNIAATKFYYYPSSAGKVTFNTYSMQDGIAGYALPYCSGTSTYKFDVFGNSQYSYSTNGYHAVAGHETGHSQSIGHYTDTSVIALMGNNPNIEIYFTPQEADITFVHLVYP